MNRMNRKYRLSRGRCFLMNRYCRLSLTTRCYQMSRMFRL
jgi:hypothetical protein